MEVRDFFDKISDICDSIPDDCDDCPICGYCPRIGATDYFWNMPDRVIKNVESYILADWIHNIENDTYTCSNCEETFDYPFNYCPYCGIQMNTEGE